MKIKIKKTDIKAIITVEQSFTIDNHSSEKVTTSRLRKKLKEGHGLDLTLCTKNDSIVHPETTGTWEFLLRRETTPVKIKKAVIVEEVSLQEEESMIDQDLKSLRLAELKKLAKDKEIKNTSKLSKSQLLKVLSEQG